MSMIIPSTKKQVDLSVCDDRYLITMYQLSGMFVWLVEMDKLHMIDGCEVWEEQESVFYDNESDAVEQYKKSVSWLINK